MQCVCLNKDTVASKEDVYRCFSEKFCFPAYFGANLDALYDCLTDGGEKRMIVIGDREYLEETLGAFFPRLCRVISDAADENPMLIINDLSDINDEDGEL